MSLQRLLSLRNPCNVYTILWCLYYLQGTLYTTGSFFSRVLLVILLAISFYHLFLCLYRHIKFTRYFKGLLLLFILVSIYGVYRIFFETRFYVGDSFLFVKNIYLSLLPTCSYYYYAKKGKLNDEMIKVYVLFFLAICSAKFSFEKEMRLFNDSSGNVEFTINAGYSFVALLPLLFYYNTRKVFQYGLLALTMILILLSMKRGAILCGFVFLVYFLYESVRSSTSIRKGVVLIFSAALLAFLYIYIGNLLETSNYFQARYEMTLEGDASNREDLYPMFLNYFIHQTSAFSFFFGHGINGTDFIFGDGAHNDWLEFAIDFGVVGLICLFYFWFCFYHDVKKSKSNRIIHAVLLSIFITNLLRSFFSFSINNGIFFTSCALGYCLNYVSTYDLPKRSF